jgi:hypothetical protein
MYTILRKKPPEDQAHIIDEEAEQQGPGEQRA